MFVHLNVHFASASVCVHECVLAFVCVCVCVSGFTGMIRNKLDCNNQY